MSRELLQQALDALQWHYDRGYPDSPTDEPRKRDARAIRAIRDHLAAPQPKPAELLGMAVVDAIVDDGMRNAAGGIYATRVQEFAREVQIAFAQQNRVDLSGIGGGGNG